jgi:hypothetical protein
MAANPLTDTLDAIHTLAEHVLAAARYRIDGHIGLEVVPNGIATPDLGDGVVVALIGTELVVRRGDGAERAPVTTLRAAGALVGIEPGAPADVYPPATSGDLDAPLALDEPSARVLFDWYALGDAALRRFRETIGRDDPSGITLWPEHLDVAMRAADVNYGASPGDDLIAEPYVYVGPSPDQRRAGAPAAAEFWSQPFGAARTWGEVDGIDEVLAFFETGRSFALGL